MSKRNPLVLLEDIVLAIQDWPLHRAHCGELNLNGMVDAHIAVLEGELFAGDTA